MPALNQRAARFFHFLVASSRQIQSRGVRSLSSRECFVFIFVVSCVPVRRHRTKISFCAKDLGFARSGLDFNSLLLLD
jgi:hypothetical protein